MTALLRTPFCERWDHCKTDEDIDLSAKTVWFLDFWILRFLDSRTKQIGANNRVAITGTEWK
jgi:hypothetical protein